MVRPVACARCWRGVFPVRDINRLHLRLAEVCCRYRQDDLGHDQLDQGSYIELDILGNVPSIKAYISHEWNRTGFGLFEGGNDHPSKQDTRVSHSVDRRPGEGCLEGADSIVVVIGGRHTSSQSHPNRIHQLDSTQKDDYRQGNQCQIVQ